MFYFLVYSEISFSGLRIKSRITFSGVPFVLLQGVVFSVWCCADFVMLGGDCPIAERYPVALLHKVQGLTVF